MTTTTERLLAIATADDIKLANSLIKDLAKRWGFPAWDKIGPELRSALVAEELFKCLNNSFELASGDAVKRRLGAFTKVWREFEQENDR